MIYLGVPTYNGAVNSDLARALAALQCDQSVHLEIRGSSFLTECFNELLCGALNMENCTHLLLMHSDVAPLEPDFLQRMLREMQSTGADAVGAVLPIKDSRGITSTALRQPDGRVRRLSIREARTLPTTFGLEELARKFGCAPAESTLYLNTGIFLLDLKRREQIATLPFDVRNEIVQTADGSWAAKSLSEDWDWSERAARAGLKLRATRAVQAGHVGQAVFCNCCEWGTESSDPGD